MSNIPMEGLAAWLRKLPRHPIHDLTRWANEVESASARLAEATIAQPVAWLCEFNREDGSVDMQLVLDDPDSTRWADCGDGVSPFSVVPLYARPAPKGEDASGVKEKK